MSEQRTRSPEDASRIVVLVGPGTLPRIMVNALAAHFGQLTVLEEDKESTLVFVRRRLRLLGLWSTAGQVAFGLFSKFASRRSHERQKQIIEQYELQTDFPSEVAHLHIGSVNSELCRDAIRTLEPDAIFVVGTRMLSRKTLDAINVPVINYHAGINPKYRGQNGAYWARACGDDENLGATVHLVDAGVDTGEILHQVRVRPQQDDTIFTYPYLLVAASRGIAIQAIDEALRGELKPRHIPMESVQWFHPTLYGYLWTGLVRRVW